MQSTDIRMFRANKIVAPTTCPYLCFSSYFVFFKRREMVKLNSHFPSANHYCKCPTHSVKPFSFAIKLLNICMRKYNENAMFVRLFRITLHVLPPPPRWSTSKRMDFKKSLTYYMYYDLLIWCNALQVL